MGIGNVGTRMSWQEQKTETSQRKSSAGISSEDQRRISL
jgi:hypothetical protein